MPDITLKATIDYETAQPYKIELTRGQKGTYGWTITVHASSPQAVFAELNSINNHLCGEYLPPEALQEES